MYNFTYQDNGKTKCNDCGELIDVGVMNMVNHYNQCKNRKDKPELKRRDPGWSMSLLDDLLKQINIPISPRKMFLFISKGFLTRLTDEEFISFIENDDITKQCGSDCYHYAEERYKQIKSK